jgi:hypothetical protein
MVTPTGLEPVTYPLGGDCSIQLSHGAIKRAVCVIAQCLVAGDAQLHGRFAEDGARQEANLRIE